jgi:hypothetical protein
MSTPIFSTELQRKIAQKYKTVTATAVDTVLTLAVGVHHAHGYTRTRVACLMDVIVENDSSSSTTPSSVNKRDVLRLIAIWQWGYGTTTQWIPLQTILSPPSGSDFSYNPASLLICDSCVFVSGASPKGPCVFLSKPTVKETWSANFVGKESARIAHMAVTTCGVYTSEIPGGGAPSTTSTSKKNLQPMAGSSALPSQAPRLPYLAIALTDGSLSVWTYEAATKVSSKTTAANASDAIRRLLYPLCRLEGTKVLRSVPVPSDWDSNTSSNTGKSARSGRDVVFVWMNLSVSNRSRLSHRHAHKRSGLLYPFGVDFS